MSINSLSEITPILPGITPCGSGRPSDSAEALVKVCSMKIFKIMKQEITIVIPKCCLKNFVVFKRLSFNKIVNK